MSSYESGAMPCSPKNLSFTLCVLMLVAPLIGCGAAVDATIADSFWSDSYVSSVDVVLSERGAVVDGVDVSGGIVVAADDVLIRNVKVSNQDGPPIVVLPGLEGVEIVGAELTCGATSGAASVGVSGDKYRAEDVRVTGCAHAFLSGADAVIGPNTGTEPRTQPSESASLAEATSEPEAVAVEPTPEALDEQAAPAEPADVELGPTGQWPSEYGFPPYDTAASIVTDGSLAGLRAALVSLAGTGGVIEHPGDLRDIGDPGLTRTGDSPIVIRPPLGQRAEFSLTGNVYLRGDAMLLAGWRHESGSIYPYDVVNSGAAWIESDGGGQFRVTARSETERTVVGIWYEAVYRNYVLDVGYDRSTVNAIADETEVHLDVVGVWLAGHARPEGTSAHVDTIQIVLTNGGQGGASITNSVVWPSSNVALQGTGATGFTITNSWFAEPAVGRALFPSGDPGPGLDGHGAVTGKAQIVGSTMLGNTHPRSDVEISGSVLYMPGSTYRDVGGNTVLDEFEGSRPPMAPTHQDLDEIWHP